MKHLFWSASFGTVLLLAGCQEVRDQTGLMQDQEQNYIRTQEGSSLKGVPVNSKQYFEVPELASQKSSGMQPVDPALKPPTRGDERSFSKQSNVSPIGTCRYVPLDDRRQLPCGQEIAFSKVLADLKKAQYTVTASNASNHQIVFEMKDRLGAVPGRYKFRYVLEFRALSASLTEMRLLNAAHGDAPLVIKQKLSQSLQSAEAGRSGWTFQIGGGS